jgi:manganese efflux pump family protein
MGGIIRAAGPAGLLAAMLAAGCSLGPAAPYQATMETCFAFGVQALQRQIAVTAVPRACSGLSQAQINLALARAVREVAGPGPKAVARRLEYKESGYLAHLINTVPSPRPVPLAVAAARHSTGAAPGLAALAAWILTAAAGLYLLVGLVAHGGLRRGPRRPAGLPPVIIIGHVALAVAGLGIWSAFVAFGVPVLARIAVGLIVATAGLGMATLVAALPEPAAIAGPASRGPALATRIAVTEPPARMRMPVTVIVVHGVVATATILLVLLAAIGAA